MTQHFSTAMSLNLFSCACIILCTFTLIVTINSAPLAPPPNRLAPIADGPLAATGSLLNVPAHGALASQGVFFPLTHHPIGTQFITFAFPPEQHKNNELNLQEQQQPQQNQQQQFNTMQFGLGGGLGNILGGLGGGGFQQGPGFQNFGQNTGGGFGQGLIGGLGQQLGLGGLGGFSPFQVQPPQPPIPTLQGQPPQPFQQLSPQSVQIESTLLPHIPVV